PGHQSASDGREPDQKPCPNWAATPRRLSTRYRPESSSRRPSLPFLFANGVPAVAPVGSRDPGGCRRPLEAGRTGVLQRNTIYSEERKVILFVTTDYLIEMLSIKERGEDPSDLIMDMVERFYMQHE